MTEKHPTTVVDAQGLILGRMATQVAKLLRKGHKVRLLNCEKAVVSGTRSVILKRAYDKRNYGNALTGPYVSRRPDFYVKRTIRGMMPHKKPSGREQFKRLKCYIGVPPEFIETKKETFKEASSEKLTIKYVTIKDICKSLGGKV